MDLVILPEDVPLRGTPTPNLAAKLPRPVLPGADKPFLLSSVLSDLDFVSLSFSATSLVFACTSCEKLETERFENLFCKLYVCE